MMACLSFATIVLFAVMRRNHDLRPREGGVLLILYTRFIGWMGLESFGVVCVLQVAD